MLTKIHTSLLNRNKCSQGYEKKCYHRKIYQKLKKSFNLFVNISTHSSHFSTDVKTVNGVLYIYYMRESILHVLSVMPHQAKLVATNYSAVIELGFSSGEICGKLDLHLTGEMTTFLCP